VKPLLFFTIFIWIGLSWVLAYRLRSQVNLKLIPPERAKVWPSWNYWQTLQLHREFYPTSHLRLAIYLYHVVILAECIAMIFLK
jgi:hypothetical protein